MSWQETEEDTNTKSVQDGNNNNFDAASAMEHHDVGLLDLGKLHPLGLTDPHQDQDRADVELEGCT